MPRKKHHHHHDYESSPVLQLVTDGFLESHNKNNHREFKKASRPPSYDDDNDNNEDEAEKNDTIIVDSISSAFQTATAQKFMVFVIMMTYLSVVCLAIAIPTMAAVPGGFFDEDGLFKFISIGFKQHSALASFIWGICTTFIILVRFIGIVLYVRSPRLAILYSIILTVTMGAGIATVRYDELIDIHFVAAGIWIASSLVFYGTVTAFNRAYSSVNGGRGMKIVWSASVLVSILFLAFIIQYNTNGRSANDFMIAGVNEYLTAFLILVMDFMLSFSIHTRFLHSADLLSDL